MLLGKRVVVVLPAYNSATTLRRTVESLSADLVDTVVVVDDASSDDTVGVARQLGLDLIVHPQNRGYGGNQKTCYARACSLNADIVVMLHPDYQYTPRLLRAMISLIAEDVYDVVLGSRILGRGARKGGMPLYKYVANRVLTLIENLLIGEKLSEFHTGYRAFARRTFDCINISLNSDDFVFDNEMLVQCFAAGLRVGEISCPTSYHAEASSIGFARSVTYGFGCLRVGASYLLHRCGLVHIPRFASQSRPS